MNYHINTILIWDSFKGGGCPLCAIESEVEKGIASQFLNEAVMDDGCRAQVNKYGFCKTHLKKLYGGDNKLGLALQAHTRLTHLKSVTGGAKSAGFLAKTLKKELSTCVICNIIGMHMEKYCAQIEKMFGENPEFKKLFAKAEGFCLPHYLKLSEASKNKDFFKALKNLQNNALENICSGIKYFTEKYDYKNAGKPWKGNEDALKKSINFMHGKAIE
jgi:hypothetical protein